MELITLTRLVIMILANMRITHIILEEDTPFGILEKLHNRFDKYKYQNDFRGTIAHWLTCIYCGSVAIGIFLFPSLYLGAILLNEHFNTGIFVTGVDLFLTGFATSQMVIFFAKLLPNWLIKVVGQISASKLNQGLNIHIDNLHDLNGLNRN